MALGLERPQRRSEGVAATEAEPDGIGNLSGCLTTILIGKERIASSELVEQRLGVLEHRRVEAFGEPVMDRRQQIVSFGALALVTPEPGAASSGAQLPELRTLGAPNSNRSAAAELPAAISDAPPKRCISAS